jgi:hypothetical protein
VSSSYKGNDIFGSGPHRFSMEPVGLFVATKSAINAFPTPGSIALGLLELEVVVTGRLIADTDADLWDLRDAITDLAIFPTDPGDLEDHHARVWTEMTLHRFETADRVDRGRRVSIAYVARFRQFEDDVTP